MLDENIVVTIRDYLTFYPYRNFSQIEGQLTLTPPSPRKRWKKVTPVSGCGVPSVGSVIGGQAQAWSPDTPHNNSH